MSDDGGFDGQNGFESAFDGLFRIAYAAAYRILRSREDCEDVAIDALARASIRWRSIQDHSEAWVTRVSINLAIDELRRHKRSKAIVDPIFSGPSEIAISDTTDLMSAIDRLPRRQRMAISLRYLSELTERETAEALGCTTGTVKQHTSRGLVSLRRELGRETQLAGEG
jgi:RNA polymerase sigma factor (sigma-70 family)